MGAAGSDYALCWAGSGLGQHSDAQWGAPGLLDMRVNVPNTWSEQRVCLGRWAAPGRQRGGLPVFGAALPITPLG